MKKDNIRDYATEAFRHYAALGRPDPEALKEELYRRALEDSKKEFYGTSNGISKPTEAAIIRAEKMLDLKEAELLDLIAVHKTLEIIAAKDINMFAAVEIVYLKNPKERIRKGTMSARVNSAALEIPAAVCTIYAWLREARTIFALERKLWVNENKLKYKSKPKEQSSST